MVFSQAVVVFRAVKFWVTPVELDHAKPEHQGIVHPVLNDLVARVLVGHDPVDVFTGLLRSGLVFGVTRLKTDEVPAAGKNLHQRRHDKTDRIRDIATHDLALVLDFVSERFAVVEIRSGIAEAGMLFLLIEDGVIDLVLDDAMDFGVVKFSHINALHWLLCQCSFY